MKKKDYELIAGVFYPFCTEMADGNITLSKTEKRGARVAAIRMANKLGENDTKFDRNKFLIACGIEAYTMTDEQVKTFNALSRGDGFKD